MSGQYDPFEDKEREDREWRIAKIVMIAYFFIPIIIGIIVGLLL